MMIITFHHGLARLLGGSVLDISTVKYVSLNQDKISPILSKKHLSQFKTRV
jgi:hypothetical protein